MKRHEIAPGYNRISGKRPPPASWGERAYVQLRNGMCPDEPWPVARTKSGQTRWVWGERPDPFDIVAVRKA
jgi:hypothetical protein